MAQKSFMLTGSQRGHFGPVDATNGGIETETTWRSRIQEKRNSLGQQSAKPGQEAEGRPAAGPGGQATSLRAQTDVSRASCCAIRGPRSQGSTLVTGRKLLACLPLPRGCFCQALRSAKGVQTEANQPRLGSPAFDMHRPVRCPAKLGAFGGSGLANFPATAASLLAVSGGLSPLKKKPHTAPGHRQGLGHYSTHFFKAPPGHRELEVRRPQLLPGPPSRHDGE